MSVETLQQQIAREAKEWGERRIAARTFSIENPLPSPRGNTVPAPAPGPQLVHRDPCFKCGVRGDIGCDHKGRVA